MFKANYVWFIVDGKSRIIFFGLHYQQEVIEFLGFKIVFFIAFSGKL
ncbi:MAG: hypothetical protein ACI9DJ_001525 [Algoriphagus sp.]|jgi:hypothetical protein